jgi:hypothetical protein
MTKDIFEVDSFIHNMNLLHKHPEVFNSGKTKLIKIFIDYFIKYTKIINDKKTGGLDNLITHIKKDFSVNSDSYDQLQLTSWNEEYFKYGIKKTNNDVYVFPRNVGGEKLTLQHKYFVNCIKIENIKPDSLCVVNRNNHMMLAGSSKDDDSELGKELHFKILILHNKELKKWLVVPYKIVSRPNIDVC